MYCEAGLAPSRSPATLSFWINEQFFDSLKGLERFISSRLRPTADSAPGLGGRQRILVHIAQIILTIVLAGISEFPLGLVEMQLIVGHIYYAAGYVGTMVAGALQIGEDVGPDKTGHTGTFALLKPEDVPGAQALFKVVDDLLQRFHREGQRDVVFFEGLQSHVQYFADGGDDDG